VQNPEFKLQSHQKKKCGFIDGLSTTIIPVQVRCWWFTPVTTATQEAEIKRIVVRSQPRQIVQTLSQKNSLQKKGWWSGSRYRVQTPVPK
jgi:hypothetical protein